MVPSLPTLSIASAMISPIVVSQLAETVATCAISVLSLTFLADLGEFRDSGLDGLVDAALEAGGVGTGGHVLEAFAIDRFGEHGRGGGAVAGDVAGLAGDFADELGAHVFIGIFELDFLGDGHAVLGDSRAAEFFVEDRHCDRMDREWPSRLSRASRRREARTAVRIRQTRVVWLP